jgi:hypothetical protein
MKLNMNLIREILKALKAKDINDVDSAAPRIEGYSEEENSYHYNILKEEGFIIAKKHPSAPVWAVLPGQAPLTLEGENFHRFLRDDTNWSKVKNLEDFLEVLNIYRRWKS